MTAAPAAATPAPASPQCAEFDRLFAEIATNRLPVPNWHEFDLAAGIGHIAAAGLMVDSGVCWATIPDVDRGKGNYVRFFKNTRHGAFDGTGMAIVFTAASVGKVGRFAICQHVKALDAGANPSRGWSPGHCVHCGCDLSTDSTG
jgi:hypothetical protein